MKVNTFDNVKHIYKFDENKNNEQEKTTDRNSNDLDKTAFLRLLTTQLANQDPLNPIEDREFIAQLAQFTSLEQIQNLNKSVENLGKEVVESMERLNINQIQADIQMLKEIVNIRKAMENYIGIEPKPVDKAELDSKIEMVQSLEQRGFTVESWKLLQKALVTAREVVENEEATKEEIEKAYEELITAIEGLKEVESEKGN